MEKVTYKSFTFKKIKYLKIPLKTGNVAIILKRDFKDFMQYNKGAIK